MNHEQPAILLRNVGFLREGRWILRDVNWSVPAGACAAILGPNGSGKSTLARILATQLWPTRGKVTIAGGQFGDASLSELRRKIRLVQPAGPLEVDPQLTANEVVLTGFFGTIGLYDRATDAMRAEAESLLNRVGLQQVKTSRYETLSTGERMRCLLARALAVRPALLLLDEPTAGLDLLAREQVLAAITRMTRDDPAPPTIVLITHHVEELPPATSHLLLLSDGKVAADGPPEQVLQSEMLSRVFGCPVEVTGRNGRYSLHVNPVQWERIFVK